MASKYDFRILIDTIDGVNLSYGTQSLVEVQPNTSLVVNTDEMVDKINNMPKVQFYNGKTYATASSLFLIKGSTQFSGSTGVGGGPSDYQFVSASIKGNRDSGSIVFHANNVANNNGDFIKRYKFFGNKVCNVLGVPENYWIYADKFRFTNTGSEQNYISGDVLAQSLHLRDNFAISNAGAIESDLPMKHAKDTDRWLKWTDVSSSIPQNDMLIGYSNQSNEYMIRMQNNKNLIISSSAVTASGDLTIGGSITTNITASGNISASGIVKASEIQVNGTSVIENIAGSTTQGVITRTLGGLDQSVVLTDLRTSGNPKFNHITASGNISASGTNHEFGNTLTINGEDPQFRAFESDTEFFRLHMHSNDFDIGCDDGDDIHFGHYSSISDSSISTKMIIKSTGNVGIGDTTPDAKLDVDGDVIIEDELTVKSHITASGNISSSGNYIGHMPAFFKASLSDNSTSNEMIYFVLNGYEDEQDDDANDVYNRLIMPFDGYVRKLDFRATTNDIGIALFRIFKVTSGNDPADVDDGTTSGNDFTSSEPVSSAQLGSGVQVVATNADQHYTANFGTSYSFNAGDIISVGVVGSDMASSKQVDGMLTLMFDIN